MKIEIKICNLKDEELVCHSETYLTLTCDVNPEADFNMVIKFMLKCLDTDYIQHVWGKSLVCEIDNQIIPYSCTGEIGTVREVYEYYKLFEDGEA